MTCLKANKAVYFVYITIGGGEKMKKRQKENHTFGQRVAADNYYILYNILYNIISYSEKPCKDFGL
jgi:hypothetical protein